MAGPAEIDRYLAHITPGLAPLMALAGAALPAAWAARLPGLVATLAETFKARARDAQGMTLVHGDLNPGNLLVSRDGHGPVAGRSAGLTRGRPRGPRSTMRR